MGALLSVMSADGLRVKLVSDEHDELLCDGRKKAPRVGTEGAAMERSEGESEARGSEAKGAGVASSRGLLCGGQ